MQDKHPEISVIIVARNEEAFIRDCILSIREQFRENENWELILVDGMSGDKTKEVAAKSIQEAGVLHFRIIDNPKKTLATGWNLGIRAAKADFVIRPDAHAILYPAYISKGLETLHKMPEVAVVGGSLETLAKNYRGKVIREALSSKAGVGNSSFRTNAQSGYKDTAVYGIYRKEVFEKTGYFNENLVRHQDNEFHKRLLDKGFKIYMNREMKAGYYCRDSVSGLLNQMFKIGYYLPDLTQKNSMGGLRIRHLAPGIFFLAVFLGVILGFVHKTFLCLSLFALSFYLGVIIINTLIISIQKKRLRVFWLVLLIPAMHFAYFLGTLSGFLKKLK